MLKLEQLILESNEIEDIKPLSGLHNLQILILSYNKINDISTLKELPNLKSVYLYGNNLDITNKSTNYDTIMYLQKEGVNVYY